MMIRLLFALVLFLIAATFASCGGDSQEADLSNQTAQQAQVANRSTPQVKPTSDIVRFSVLDINGKQRRSDEWIGQQPVVINVWGTWCPPCRREIPDLVRLYEEYHGKGIEMLGLAVRDSPQQVEGFAAKYNMKWVMMIAERDLLYTLGATKGVPTTIFYDRNGKEVSRFVGGRDYGTLKKAFESIL